jgi:hypothetical protein
MVRDPPSEILIAPSITSLDSHVTLESITNSASSAETWMQETHIDAIRIKVNIVAERPLMVLAYPRGKSIISLQWFNNGH